MNRPRKKDPIPEENIPLVIEHVAFAKRLATQFYRKRMNLGIEKADLEGAAFLGLCDAALRYRPDKGMRFRTFSYFRIRGAMFDLLRRGGGVSRNEFKKLMENEKQRKIKEQQELGINSHVEIRNLSESSIPDTDLPYTFARSAVELASLGDVLGEVGIRIHLLSDRKSIDLSYVEESSPEFISLFRSGNQMLADLISKLPEPERTMIQLRYYEFYSFDEIGVRLGGASRSWVSRLHNKAVKNLRTMLGGEAVR